MPDVRPGMNKHDAACLRRRTERTRFLCTCRMTDAEVADAERLKCWCHGEIAHANCKLQEDR